MLRPHDGIEERFLAAEVLIEIACGDIGPFRNGGELRAEIASLRKSLKCCAQDALAHIFLQSLGHKSSYCRARSRDDQPCACSRSKASLKSISSSPWRAAR